MNQQDAEEQLRLIQQAQRRQKTVGHPEIGWFFVVWGAVWLVGFLAGQYGPNQHLLLIWLGLLLVGSALSGVVGARLGRQIQYAQTGPKLGIFYTAFVGFCAVWLLLAQPTGWVQTAVLAISFLGFALTASGILLKRYSLSISGVLVTLFAIIVYLLLPAQFGLIMGLVGGGGMIVAGLQMLRARRG